MTILLNEIHVFSDDLKQSIVIFAADTQITQNNKPSSNKKKIFKIPHLNAGIGYYGLAEITPEKSMEEWLSSYVNKDKSKDIKQFADSISKALTTSIHHSVIKSTKSGLHLCGFNQDNIPEFYHIRNFLDSKSDLLTYYTYSEDFLSTRNSNKIPYMQCYRNGDPRAHAIPFEKLDQIMQEFFALKDFKGIASLEDYADYVKFKLEITADIYKKYCKDSVIGKPIESFQLTAKRES